MKGKSTIQSVWERYLEIEARAIELSKDFAEEQIKEIMAKEYPELKDYQIEWKMKEIITP